MTEKLTFMDIERSPGPNGHRDEQMSAHPVDNGSAVGVALQALDAAKQALQLAAAAAEASRYASASIARSTLRTYASYWDQWQRWCDANGQTALPADGETIAIYIAWRARTHAPATIATDLAAIGAAHRAAGRHDPTKEQPVKTVLRGIRRTHGLAQHKKTPMVVDALRAVLDRLDDSPRGRRDRALLLIGWGAALRRSEIVALTHEDIGIANEGLVVTLRRSKTDQTGRGRVIGIPHSETPRYDAARAYCAWRGVAGGGPGPVFVSVDRNGKPGVGGLGDRTVARIVKRVAAGAGLQGDYSGHSLRAGFATSAAAAGASERSIMTQTGHKSLEVARGYIRPASIWIENAAAVAAL